MGVAFRIHSPKENIFFVQALVEQLLDTFLNKTCQLMFHSLSVLIRNTLKLYLGTSTNSPYLTNFFPELFCNYEP